MTINVNEINSAWLLLAVLLFVTTFVVSFWFLLRKSLKSSVLFDIAFMLIASGFITSRLLSVIVNLQDYLDFGFSIFPFNEFDGSIHLLAKLPWSIFAFWDGNFEFIGLLLGICIGLLIIYTNSNQKQAIFPLFDKTLLSYAISSMLLLIGIFFVKAIPGINTTSGLRVVYSDGIERFPLQIFQILFLALFLIIIFVITKNKKKIAGLITYFFLVGFSISEIILRSQSEQFSADILERFDYYQVATFVLLMIVVIMFFSQIFYKYNKKYLNKYNVNKNNISESLKSSLSEGRKKYDSSPEKYMISYSDRIREENE